MFFVFALITALLGALPWLLVRRFVGAGITVAIVAVLMTPMYYLGPPMLGNPLYGAVGGVSLFVMIVSAIIISGSTNNGYSYRDQSPAPAWIPVALMLAVFLVRFVGSSGLFRASDYASMLGTVETREWTQDVQPKDPRHVRLVPVELANWTADKHIGEAGGVVGSQFSIDKGRMMLQRVHGEFWYVAPLDYKGFRVWQSTDAAPGYVMVHGEDPLHPAVMHLGKKFRYTPGAFLGNELYRHIWLSGYTHEAVAEAVLEIDENDNPWWVAALYQPTIGWSGEKITRVLVINPEDGTITDYEPSKVPDWVDRVYPASLVKSYIAWNGEYQTGWWNSVWAHLNIIEPDDPNLVYGSDGQAYWVTGLTSTNLNDLSLVGLMYTSSRTGQTVRYHAVGGTDEALMSAVNNKVNYLKFHAAQPMLYNIGGVMSAIVPVLGENHTFQGVALVDVENQQVAFGTTAELAYRDYQKVLAGKGNAIAPDQAHDLTVIRGVVDRFASDVSGGESRYYLALSGNPHLFQGTSTLSPELAVTQKGDEVELRFVTSGEKVEPLVGFDNTSLSLVGTANEMAVDATATARTDEVRDVRDERSARGTVENMTPEELRELLELRKKSQSKN